MSWYIYKFDPARFFITTGLVWQAVLKKDKVKLDLLTDTDILLMKEKGIREGIFHFIHWHTKANNKYMKDYDKKKEFPYLK